MAAISADSLNGTAWRTAGTASISYNMSNDMVEQNGGQLNGTVVHLAAPPSGRDVLAFYLVMFCMIGAQSALFWWKKAHKRTYELVTLLGLWVVPVFFAARFQCWRFITVWFLYSCITGYWLYICTRSKISSKVPGQVYSWFFTVYKVSVALGIAGYVLFVLQVLMPVLLFSTWLPAGLPATLLWYGLYFGVLGRDCAEVTSDRMAAVMGTGRRLVVSVKACGMCGADLPDFGAPAASVAPGDRSVTLACKHSFHRHCIQGWTIVGKKDCCPQCMEKVDLRSLYSDRPWLTQNLNWMQMLDAVRYMVVWFPLILILAHFCLKELGLGPKPQEATAAAGTQAAIAHTEGMNFA